jgi:hypothetical protein
MVSEGFTRSEVGTREPSFPTFPPCTVRYAPTALYCG